MKNIAPVVLFVALLPRLADAQQTDHDFPRTYLFAAPGLATPGSSATLGLGGGIEAPSTPAFLGYSMEVSYLAPVHQFGDGRGLLCFDASHFVRLSKKHFRIEPFIEAGYTRELMCARTIAVYEELLFPEPVAASVFRPEAVPASI